MRLLNCLREVRPQSRRNLLECVLVLLRHCVHLKPCSATRTDSMLLMARCYFDRTACTSLSSVSCNGMTPHCGALRLPESMASAFLLKTFLATHLRWTEWVKSLRLIQKPKSSQKSPIVLKSGPLGLGSVLKIPVARDQADRKSWGTRPKRSDEHSEPCEKRASDVWPKFARSATVTADADFWGTSTSHQ